MLMKNILHMQVLINSVYSYNVISYVQIMYSSLWLTAQKFQATIAMGQLEMLRFLHDNGPNSVP